MLDPGIKGEEGCLDSEGQKAEQQAAQGQPEPRRNEREPGVPVQDRQTLDRELQHLTQQQILPEQQFFQHAQDEFLQNPEGKQDEQSNQHIQQHLPQAHAAKEDDTACLIRPQN